MNLQFPGTTTPTGPAYVNPDTVIIADAKKTYGDNSPREIFKWPIKFVADGANNTKRAEPNLRYEWQVRCECGHSGDGIESPWSDIKIFNTPDFDPVTGTYTPLPGQEDLSLTKHMDMESMEVRLYPNPNDGNFRISIVSNTEGEEVFLTLRDIQGKLIEQRSIQLGKHISDILWNSSKSLEKGVYLIEINAEQYRATKRVIIDK